MVEFRSLRPEEMEDWLDHCMIVFNKGEFSASYRQYFKNHWVNDPWRDMESIFVAVEDGKILSTVRLFHRKIYIAGQPVTMGGIGEVSTKPEYRGRGLSSKLLSMAIEKMEQLDIKVSMLGTGIQAFYGRLGWQDNIQYEKIAEPLTAEELPSMEGYTLRPMNFDEDYPSMMKIHEEYSPNFNGPIVRDDLTYWQMWVKTECKKGWVVEDKAGQIAAYACTSEKEEHLFVREFGAYGVHIGIFDWLISRICKLEEKEKTAVHFGAPISSNMKVTAVNEHRGMMLRLNRPFTVGNQKIENTQQLIDVINDTEEQGIAKYLFWGIDGF